MGLLWHSRPRLCFLFFARFGVTGFPAVGDLGQELADVFDLGEGPKMNAVAAQVDYFWSWDLAFVDVAAKSNGADSEQPRRLGSREFIHSGMSVPYSKKGCQTPG